MGLDTSKLENGVVLSYNEQLRRFRRDISHPEPMQTRISYKFGFPRIDESRFGIVDIYDIDSDKLPDSVKEYFTCRNKDQYCAYIYEFYPNGRPTRKNERVIRRREGKGAGTAGFKLIREDLARLDVRNVFLTPMTERMIVFLEHKRFDKITEGRPFPSFPLTVSLYGTILS